MAAAMAIRRSKKFDPVPVAAFVFFFRRIVRRRALAGREIFTPFFTPFYPQKTTQNDGKVKKWRLSLIAINPCFYRVLRGFGGWAIVDSNH